MIANDKNNDWTTHILITCFFLIQCPVVVNAGHSDINLFSLSFMSSQTSFHKTIYKQLTYINMIEDNIYDSYRRNIYVVWILICDVWNNWNIDLLRRGKKYNGKIIRFFFI